MLQRPRPPIDTAAAAKRAKKAHVLREGQLAMIVFGELIPEHNRIHETY